MRPHIIIAVVGKTFEKIYTEINSQTLCVFCFVGSDNTIVPPKRMYTVNLPPEDYVADIPDAARISASETSESSGDSTGKCVWLLL